MKSTTKNKISGGLQFQLVIQRMLPPKLRVHAIRGWSVCRDNFDGPRYRVRDSRGETSHYYSFSTALSRAVRNLNHDSA